MYNVILAILAAMLCVIRLVMSKTETTLESSSNVSFCKLQQRFFLVYFLASFADWLQGPYIYKLYSYYGYDKKQIALLYVIGFASSVTFGSAVGCLADKFGRRKLCVLYNITNSLACLTKLSSNYGLLVLGRVFSGISTSILFSVFEAWYVYQHIEHYKFPIQWISVTLAKSTFYNGLLAILAGILSSFIAEWMNFGPVSPFILALPCLMVSAIFATKLWDETDVIVFHGYKNVCIKTFNIIFSCHNSSLILLGLIQSLFESVMYVFIFLWTPVLESISPPHGIVFACFMVCIMIGSSLYSFLIYYNYQPKYLMTSGIVLAGISLSICTISTHLFHAFYAEVCFIAFLGYEIAVGIYFPAIGYLRSRIVPEEFRASIINWFRFPMNFITCTFFLWLNFLKDHNPNSQHSNQVGMNFPIKINNTYNEDTDISHVSYTAFFMCSVALLFASILSLSLSRRYEKCLP